MALSVLPLSLFLTTAAAAPPEEPTDEVPLLSVTPPRPLTPTAVPYPAGAPTHSEPVVVRVRVVIDAAGAVESVHLRERSDPVFEQAVLAAVARFLFEPARMDGIPIAVEIDFEQTFNPPPPPQPLAETDVLDAVLRGRLREHGTRRPAKGAVVDVTSGGRSFHVEAGADGTFELALPAGPARVEVQGAGYQRFLAHEDLAAGQELSVGYLLDRDTLDPFESVVIGKRRREEVSSIVLRGPELTTIPGTFGDPFRVIGALPGVASVASLLPFPVVRGASPSSTGFLLDGTRIPALFHLLAGPSVIHPEFIDEVEFYPGNAPVLYGGYIGGIVDGRTRRARPDETLADVDLNLLQAGGLARTPVEALGSTITAAGRIGYPGLVLGLATNQASLSYWDYQLRLDRGDGRNRATIFLFGSNDELLGPAPGTDPLDPDPELVPALVIGFHRADLRYQHGSGAFDAEYRLVAGVDQTRSSGADVQTVIVEPSVRFSVALDEKLVLVTGLEGAFHGFTQGDNEVLPSEDVDLGQFTGTLSELWIGSALAELRWRPTARWIFRPGIRSDVYQDGTTTLTAVDPRLAVRFRLVERDLPELPAGSDERGLWLKGGIGLFHQPPRFFLPLPGLDVMPLEYGLLSAVQTSAGVEVPFAGRLGLDVQGFFNFMDPVVFDASTNPLDVVIEANPTLIPTTSEPPPGTVDTVLQRLVEPQVGRSYGVEVLLRRRPGAGPYGWIAYTLSRSERRQDGDFSAYDYDRSHLLNLVGGFPLGDGWDVGARLQYGSGKPATTTTGYNAARIDGYFRLDVRMDRRITWNSWLLDFYVDLTNAVLFAEEVTPGSTLRYVLPTVGLRGRL